MDATGLPVRDLRHQLTIIWWDRRHRSTARARPLLDRLYPRDVAVDWGPSCAIFRRPTVQKGTFVHPAPPAVIKWMARIRTGCLATRMRLVRHGMLHGSTTCRCCGAADEDDDHLLTGCPATGAADWKSSLLEIWRAVALGLQVTVPDPSDSWLADHRYLLLAALLPAHLAVDCGVPHSVAPRFLARLHSALAAATAERLRRRGELLAQAAEISAAAQPGSSSQPPTSQPVSSLPAERRLTVRDIRQVEATRRRLPSVVETVDSEVTPRVPIAGEARRRWLRQRLSAVIREDMEVCLAEQGVESVVVLELFERVTGEAFADTPGVAVGQRIRGMAKVLGNISREEDITPPLESTTHVRHCGRMTLWNRRPRAPVDVRAWRRQVEALELRAVPVPRLRTQMASVDIGLAAWIHDHRYLVATDVASGESGMALLLLWEVDHERTFPSQGGTGLTATLGSFTKRLQARVAKDPRLAWLQSADMAVPLSPGLAPTHHKRWSVRVLAPAPAEPRGWYDDFLARWRAYIETLVSPPGSRPTAEVTADQLARVRPALICTPTVGDGATSSTLGATLMGPTHTVAPPRAPPRRRVKPPAAPVEPLVQAATPATGSRQLDPLHLEDVPPAVGDVATSSTTGAAVMGPSHTVATPRAPPRRQVKRPAVSMTPVVQTPAQPLDSRQFDHQPPQAMLATHVVPMASPQSPPARHPPEPRGRRRRDESVDIGPAARRQRTLLSWIRPASASSVSPTQRAASSASRHGRAVEGPLT